MDFLRPIPERPGAHRLAPIPAEAFALLLGEPVDRVTLELDPKRGGRLVGFRGFLAIALGETVYFSRRGARRLARGDASALAFLAHELFHVCQWRGHGRVLFLARYLGSYARHRLLGASGLAAYRSLGLEQGAFQAEAHLSRWLGDHPALVRELTGGAELTPEARAHLAGCAEDIRQDPVCFASLSWRRSRAR